MSKSLVFSQLRAEGSLKMRWWPEPTPEIRRNPYHLALWWVVLLGQEIAHNLALLNEIRGFHAEEGAVRRLRGVIASDRSHWEFWLGRLRRLLRRRDEARQTSDLAWWSPVATGEFDRIQAVVQALSTRIGSPGPEGYIQAAQEAAEAQGAAFARPAREWVDAWVRGLKGR